MRRLSLFHPTEPWMVEALLKVETFGKEVWEPCCGEGHISKVLTAHGFEVYSSELDTKYRYGDVGVDFLKTWRHVDSIITNPPWPFDGGPWLNYPAHAIYLARKVAMLMPFYFLDHSQRRRFIRQNPPKAIYLLDANVWGIHATAWWVWERDWTQETVIRWLDKPRRKRR